VSGTLLAKSLSQQRRGLVGWSIGALAVIWSMVALWPSVHSMGDISGFMDRYPDAIKDLFDIDSITTGRGYLNAELFSIILPAMFIVFAVSRGARSIAGEEEAGRLGTLLTLGLPRRRAVIESALSVAGSTLALAGATWVAIFAGSAVMSMGVSPGAAASAATSMWVLGALHGMVALAVGAATGRRSAAAGAGGALAVAGYVLYVAGQLVDALHPWQWMSPFAQALRGGPIGAGLPSGYLVLALVAVLVVGASIPAFDRRDVAG
jgi:ABC-2 type transport system permease protein